MKKVILLILAILITLAGGYLYLQNGDKAIGAIVWVGEDHEEAPAVESFTLEYINTEDDGREILVSDDRLMVTSLIEIEKDGEVVGVTAYQDPRLDDGFCEHWDEDSRIDVTIHVDQSKELRAYFYKIYEKSNGELYAKTLPDESYVYMNNGAAGYRIGFEDRNRTLGVIQFAFEPFEPTEWLSLKSFNHQDQIIDITEISADGDGVAFIPKNTAYTICEFQFGDKIERKLFEKDKLTYIALNKKLHIGVKSELRLIEEED